MRGGPSQHKVKEPCSCLLGFLSIDFVDLNYVSLRITKNKNNFFKNSQFFLLQAKNDLFSFLVVFITRILMILNFFFFARSKKFMVL